MKPDEILGMVEEAAGTRMYETKRIAALKTIDKKQMKLDELNSVLSEEITPTLVRLRGEKQHYLKWSKNNTDIERIERFVTAHEYFKAQQILEQSEGEAVEMEEEIKQAEHTVSNCLREVSEKEQEIEELSIKLNGAMNEEHKQAKLNEENVSKDLVKATAAWKNCKDAALTSKEDLAAAQASVTEIKNAITTNDNEISKDKENIDEAKSNADDAEKELARLQEEYQNMCAGISSAEGGEGMTLPDQISKAHNDANNAEARSKQAEMKIKHLTKTIKVSLYFYLPFIFQ